MPSTAALGSLFRTLKWVLFGLVIYFFVLPLIPGVRQAVSDLSRVRPELLVLGLALEASAIFAYSVLTHLALGESGRQLSIWRLYRIQLSTRSLGNVVPGGSAAASALGFRLLRLSGVAGPDAGFALATAGLGSAVILNLLLWFGLIVSIPVRGVNPIYGAAAVVGIILMLVAAALVFGLVDGQGRAERAIRWLASRFGLDPDRVTEVMNHLANRILGLASEPRLMIRVFAASLVSWVLDAAALWVFLRAFDQTVGFDALVVAFGLANIMAAVPITPGGLGIVEGIYIPTLIGFGLTRSGATLGVLSYRLAQFWLPIVVGGLAYLSLRVGPFAIERRDRLAPLGRLAAEAATHPSSRLDFLEHYAPQDRTGRYPRPDFRGLSLDEDGNGDDAPNSSAG